MKLLVDVLCVSINNDIIFFFSYQITDLGDGARVTIIFSLCT